MQEVIDLLTEDLETTAALAYAGTTATGAAYLGYKNDFGASGMTTRELNDYLEEHSGDVGPVKMYKKHVYSKELENREADSFWEDSV